MIECKNMFYFPQINKIGGVESFYWYLVQEYKDWDIVIVFREADDLQLKRLRQYMRVVKYQKGMIIKCEKAFFNYSTDIIDSVQAGEYYQVLHGDYKALKVRPNVPSRIDKLIGVSQLVCDTFHEVTGKDLIKCYNPVSVPKPRKVLNLITATRMTREKGRDRIQKLAGLLDQSGIPWRWEIFTNDPRPFYNPNLIHRETKLDIVDDIANADYLVQLSDTEGYCFSVVEALMLSKPVIVTDCPVFKELGIKDRVNGFILDFDLSDVPIKEIYKGLKPFTYTPPADRWGELLAKGENRYKRDLSTMVSIRCTKEFFDLECNVQRKKGDVWQANLVRAEYICDAQHGELV